MSIIKKDDQLSLFTESGSNAPFSTKTEKHDMEISTVSLRLSSALGIASIPFLECDYDTIYPILDLIYPREEISFDCFDIETLIACETVCAGICHQMNWDFLRKAIFQRTQHNTQWINAEALLKITENDVASLFISYNKPERIRAHERTDILHQIGLLASQNGSFTNLFFTSDGQLLCESQIRKKFLGCGVFSHDPEEKKFALLLQKLSNYEMLSALSNMCKPTVDYHLIRCFLRRGLIYPRTKLGSEFLSSPDIKHRESTMGAMRQLCATLVREISNYTRLSINSVNQIEWHIGRSVCTEGSPDCSLSGEGLDWIRQKFDKCPFYSTCCAINFNNGLLSLDEPSYNGTSY